MPKCPHYKEIDSTAKENCPNCFRWIGIRCENHSVLGRGYETTKSYKVMDREMRSNKAVYLG